MHGLVLSMLLVSYKILAHSPQKYTHYESRRHACEPGKLTQCCMTAGLGNVALSARDDICNVVSGSKVAGYMLCLCLCACPADTDSKQDSTAVLSRLGSMCVVAGHQLCNRKGVCLAARTGRQVHQHHCPENQRHASPPKLLCQGPAPQALLPLPGETYTDS